MECLFVDLYCRPGGFVLCWYDRGACHIFLQVKMAEMVFLGVIRKRSGYFQKMVFLGVQNQNEQGFEVFFC